MTNFRNAMMAAAQTAAGSVVSVDNSALFVEGNNENLSRTPSGAGNRDTWTFSTWVYKTLANDEEVLFNAGADDNNRTCLKFNANNIQYFHFDSGGVTDVVTTTAVYRDIGWLHIVLAVDTTSGTEAHRVRIYVNGSEIDSFSASNYPTQNTDTDVNSTVAHVIGCDISGSNDLDAYLAETVLIDGLQLAPTSFGEFDSTGLYWTPKSSDDIKALTFGTNGFYLDNTTNAQTDASGEGNNFTNNNSVTTDSNSPTNTYAVQNSLTIAASNNSSLSNGNLKQTGNSGGYWAGGILATLPCDGGGKYYWEAKCLGLQGTSQYIGLGVAPMDLPRFPNTDGAGNFANPGNTGYQGGSILFNGSSYTNLRSNNQSQDDNINSSLTIAVNDFMQIAFDSSNGKLWYGKNNSWYNSGNPATGANPSSTLTATDKTWFPWFGTYTASDIWQINYGATDFEYTPPTGFNKVTTSQIAEDTTRTASDTTEYFETTLYEGTGSEQNVVSDTTTNTSAFSWIKNRDATDNHMLFDRVRGATKDLHSNTTDIEVTNAQTVKAFTGGGVTLGTDVEVNTNNESYVLWNWMIGTSGSGSSNEDGSINTTATLVDGTIGLSISTYTGTGSAATIGHGLGVVPEMIIVKKRAGDSSSSWAVYHKYSDASAPEDKYLLLDSTGAVADLAGMWNDTAPTSSVFSVGDTQSTNESSDTYVAYCFAPSQFISIGSYTGNGNANGTFIPTLNSLGVSIQPSWIMIKASSRTSPWTIYDTSRLPYNVNTKAIEADANTAEQTHGAAIIDIVTGGVKTRGSSYYLNQSSATYVYMAIGTPIIDTDGRIIAGR